MGAHTTPSGSFRLMSLPTLKSVHDRCEEVGDCWLWAQGVNGAGHPGASHDGRHVLIRRHVLALCGHELRSGWVAVTTCREQLCVQPKHLEQITRSELVKRSYLHSRNTDAEYAKRAMSAKHAKLDFTKAREIRAADATAKELASQYGVTKGMIDRIRQGKAWREEAPNSSVFNLAQSA